MRKSQSRKQQKTLWVSGPRSSVPRAPLKRLLRGEYIDERLVGHMLCHPVSGIVLEYQYSAIGEDGRLLHCGMAVMPSGARGMWCWFADELDEGT